MYMNREQDIGRKYLFKDDRQGRLMEENICMKLQEVVFNFLNNMFRHNNHLLDLNKFNFHIFYLNLSVCVSFLSPFTRNQTIPLCKSVYLIYQTENIQNLFLDTKTKYVFQFYDS